MNNTFQIEGHTIEFRTSASGSLDPWTSEYARNINFPLMCTADMAKFMLVDGSHIYKFESFEIAYDLVDKISNGSICKWKEFIDWISDTRRTRDFGTLEESIEGVKEAQRRDSVWKSFPKDRKREIYEFLKTLSKEEKEAWYQEKFKELGI